MDEREIVERIKNKDEDAFIEFVDAYKKKLVMFCYSYTKDIHEAEDLSQEVFIKFYKSIDYFRFESSISTYLFQIARNYCIDYYRRKRIRQIFIGLDKAKESVEYMNNEDRMIIRQCILDLPENLRTMVILYYYVGMSEKDIGKIFNISNRAVEGRLYRAKQKLKKEFEKGEVILCKEEKTI